MFGNEEKQILQFFNGEKLVYADPIEVNRRIYHLLDDPATTVEKAGGSKRDDAGNVLVEYPEPVVFEAMNKLVAAIRFAFDMPPIDPDTGKGATHADCMAAWEDFCAFMVSKKKPDDISPTSSPPSIADSPTA